jgi:hypothetical protein
MSFTTAIEQRTESRQSGTILLTPSKRQRASHEGESSAPCASSTAELWKWTLTHDAIAPCFVRDVFKMKEHGETGKGKHSWHLLQDTQLNMTQGADFFWLGRVPCRTVRIVGLVVGVKTYEKRIVYTGIRLLFPSFTPQLTRIWLVDDGTAVIDCTHRQPPANKPQGHTKPEPPVTPKPTANVGHAVCVVGKVKLHYETRQIVVDSLGDFVVRFQSCYGCSLRGK